MSYAMKIRAAAPADRARIDEILAGTGRFTPEEIGWAMDLVDHALRGGGPGGYEAYVLEDPENAIAGYVCFAPTPRADGVYDLYWLAVDVPQQGKGFGWHLLQFVENEIRRRNGRMLLIETSSKESYAPTRRFYERAGYEEISRIKDFYRVEDDKIVFCKYLIDS